MKASWLRIFFLLCIMIYVGVSSCEQTKPSSNPPELISVYDYEPTFPERTGFSEFKAGCISCHSLQYIEMQPDFPKTTWEVIVNKMRKNFGAPVSDSAVQKIVQYLVDIKGTKYGN